MILRAGIGEGERGESGAGGSGYQFSSRTSVFVLFFISLAFVSAWMSKVTDG